MKEMTEDKKLEAERKELNLLIRNGIVFDIEVTTLQRDAGFKGFIGKRRNVKKTHRFKIEEPTLSTLDRLSAEQIDLGIDENIMSGATGINEAIKLTSKHCRRLARIIAIAVLGQDYVISENKGSHFTYRNDDARLDELTDMFFHSIKPSKLLELVILISTVSNLGDFCNSIRLLSAERTTMPIRIEENKEG